MSAQGGARRGITLMCMVGLLAAAVSPMGIAATEADAAQAESGQGRSLRTIVLRPTAIVAGDWTESGEGLGEVSEPELEETDSYTTRARHRPLTATLGPMPTLGPGEVVTHTALHALLETGRKGVTMKLTGGGVTLAIPKGSNQLAWHVGEAGVEGEPSANLQRLSIEKTWGSRAATVYAVYVVLTIETERSRFLDSHGGTGQAGGEGRYQASTNQALPAGQTIYTMLLTRGAHGASSFRDERANTWEPVYEQAAGAFVCQVWASTITNPSAEKDTILTWEGLPAEAPVYRALVALEGEPVATEALDVAGSASGPGTVSLQASTPATRDQGDFAMALVASTSEQKAGAVAPSVEGWSDPAPTASVGEGISASFDFQTFPAESSPLSATAKAGEDGEMALFVLAVKVLPDEN